MLQELVPVAVEGTRNAIDAAADEGVRRVVFTSSYGAVHMDPNRSPDAASTRPAGATTNSASRQTYYLSLHLICLSSIVSVADRSYSSVPASKLKTTRRTCTAAPR